MSEYLTVFVVAVIGGALSGYLYAHWFGPKLYARYRRDLRRDTWDEGFRAGNDYAYAYYLAIGIAERPAKPLNPYIGSKSTD